ncbi:SIMPL domain-containing protein [Sphingomonas sp. MMS12-HWE2-04]|uniref:SIMPL domain-containing protein n=1 Tax=Sphingomonas sp. MMS12-HWE2-04 TaxID=3234199 RepID=UPI00384E529E
MKKYALALALAGVPTSVLAQAAPATGPVSVEIVASGKIEVPAQRFRISVKLTGKGKDEAAAGVALAANRAKLLAAMSALSIREAQADASAVPSSISSLMSMFGGRSKPTFSMEAVEENSDAEPQSTATETLMFDAPSRAAIASAKPSIEANSGVLEDDVIPLLADYLVPTRQAKAAAIKNAQIEADAYAASLGLRRASVSKISERQDIAASALGFVTQLISMFAPKSEQKSDEVTVLANLTVEFQLTR